MLQDFSFNSFRMSPAENVFLAAKALKEMLEIMNEFLSAIKTLRIKTISFKDLKELFTCKDWQT